MADVDQDRESRIIDAFVDLADTLVDDFDVVEFFHLLLDHALPLVRADAGGLLLHHQGALRVVASSSEDMSTLELFELQNSEGPCYDAYTTGDAITIGRLDDVADRWPHFVPEARQRGFRSAHAVPLRLRDRTIGALNLFTAREQDLAERDVSLIRGLADVATIAVLQERTIAQSTETADQLQTALDSRVIIEQAKGRIAEHTGHDMQHAFESLRRHARSHHQRLTDVARAVVSGDVPIDDLTTRSTSPVVPASTSD
jgi:GAF domain-containing protein